MFKLIKMLFLVLFIVGALLYFFPNGIGILDNIFDRFNNNKSLTPTIKGEDKTNMMNTLKITSTAFDDGGFMPSKYTCDGDNVNPPLFIDGINVDASDATKSLVLIMDDPDAPNRTWDHWVKFNVPVTVNNIPEDTEPAGKSGVGSSGNTSYNGPCPPGGSEHRYFFKVFAIDKMLDLNEGATKEEVLVAMEGHVVDDATIMGRYESKK